MDTMTATAVDHPLGRLLHHAARRSFPPADGRIEVLDPPPGPCDAAIVFTGHAVVAAAISDQWMRAHLPDEWGEHRHGSTLSVEFLGALGDQLGSAPAGISVLLAAPKGPEAGQRAELRPVEQPAGGDWAAYRTDIHRYQDETGGVVTLGQGPGGRWDVWVEVAGGELDPAVLVRGRALTAAARTLTPEGRELFASVPAHDARALRTFLAGGFHPVGAEVLFLTRPQR